MEEVYTTNGVPIKSWVTDLEDKAMDQAMNLANLPFVHSHISLMPDAHMGYGMPIGGVMATKGVVIPNAVGVDIGCGMCAIRTPFTSLGKMKEIMSRIRQIIPVGFNKHSERQDGMPGNWASLEIVSKEFANAEKSLGTLGGGNHFIEFQRSTDDNRIYVMVHSGSRNLGKQVADHYNKLAVDLNAKYYTQVDPKWQLAFLPLDSKEGQAYLMEMDYCVAFAQANREKMMDTIISILTDFGNFQDKKDGYDSLQKTRDSMINIAHNYASIEHHFGKNVMVHRKGATLAREDTRGIIPGSQGSFSYIVQGLGNADSFNSCSHGAGRIMGRKDAKERLDLETEKKKLDDQGIIHSIRSIKDLDEASGAYKDINTVMKNQEDLVDVVTQLQPIAVIKG